MSKTVRLGAEERVFPGIGTYANKGNGWSRSGVGNAFSCKQVFGPASVQKVYCIFLEISGKSVGLWELTAIVLLERSGKRLIFSTAISRRPSIYFVTT